MESIVSTTLIVGGILLVILILAALKKSINLVITLAILLVGVIGLGTYTVLVPTSLISVACSEFLAANVKLDSEGKYQDGEIIFEQSFAKSESISESIVNTSDTSLKWLIEAASTHITLENPEYILKFEDSYLDIRYKDNALYFKIIKGDLKVDSNRTANRESIST